eukprot:CAMPEP_0172733568 /NCGR_PEP_ID=MMETSP1074-20121228/107498_1 /TAXON_ID=2916 /ORGANISM="Ceratium fusus, Strain PA161109" /LENGTH=88 /DNA_ID=CAMNT_0013562157 /DNA_START=1069 /DNA_END=1335 /DNA_ORIENTATION=-
MHKATAESPETRQRLIVGKLTPAAVVPWHMRAASPAKLCKDLRTTPDPGTILIRCLTITEPHRNQLHRIPTTLRGVEGLQDIAETSLP